KMGMDTKAEGTQGTPVKLPAVKMTMDLSVKDVSPNGDINYELVVSDASVADEPGVLPQVAQAMKTSIAGTKGMSGTGTLSSRGLNKGSEIKVPASADAPIRQAAEQMKESFANLGTPL